MRFAPPRPRFVCLSWALALASLFPWSAYALERVLLQTGFSVDCTRQEQVSADRVRLYLAGSPENYLEVDILSIVSSVPLPAVQAMAALPTPTLSGAASLPELIATASGEHRLRAALLSSVVQAESGGHSHAISRAGAQGLMQLMPATAKELGVRDSFAPEDNLRGGSAYLDALLTRYHEDIALALAAYNAGPAAVDRYHGVPPFRETRSYVARIIREFNRRVTAERAEEAKRAAAAGLYATAGSLPAR